MARAAVFVSYRRDDSKHAAGRLGERLDERFTLFMDVDSIRPGSDFTAVMRDAVQQADVLLAVIGTSWLTLADEHGARRIDRPDDWVALEISTALQRDIPVIPVLVDGARMPSRDELPEWIADLANRQAITLTHESFAADCARLIETVERQVGTDHGESDVDLWADADYPSARSALLQGHWSAAIDGLERVLRRYPRHQTVVEQLEEAHGKLRLSELREQADRASAEGRWALAVDALQAIAALQPADEVAERLARARHQLQVANLQRDMRALAEAGDWAGVQAADAELTALDAEHANFRGLATLAREHLADARVEADYLLGLRQLDAEQWADGAATFAALLAVRPHYRDAEALLTLARSRLEAAGTDEFAMTPTITTGAAPPAQRQGSPEDADVASGATEQRSPGSPGPINQTLSSPPRAQPEASRPSARALPRKVVAAIAGGVLAIGTAVVLVLASGDDGAEDTSTATTPGPTVAGSSPTVSASPPSPAELLAESVPVGTWKVRTTYRYGVRRDGSRTDEDAWDTQKATWTFSEASCTDSVCRGTVSSSTGSEWPFKWDGRALMVPRDPTYVTPKQACVVASTGESSPIDQSAAITTYHYAFGEFTGSPDRLNATLGIDIEYEVFGTCEIQPSTLVRRVEEQVLIRVSDTSSS